MCACLGVKNHVEVKKKMKIIKKGWILLKSLGAGFVHSECNYHFRQSSSNSVSFERQIFLRSSK